MSFGTTSMFAMVAFLAIQRQIRRRHAPTAHEQQGSHNAARAGHGLKTISKISRNEMWTGRPCLVARESCTAVQKHTHTGG
eukprot:5260137-Amphidinium_carterae.2